MQEEKKEGKFYWYSCHNPENDLRFKYLFLLASIAILINSMMDMRH